MTCRFIARLVFNFWRSLKLLATSGNFGKVSWILPETPTGDGNFQTMSGPLVSTIWMGRHAHYLAARPSGFHSQPGGHGLLTAQSHNYILPMDGPPHALSCSPPITSQLNLTIIYYIWMGRHTYYHAAHPSHLVHPSHLGFFLALQSSHTPPGVYIYYPLTPLMIFCYYFLYNRKTSLFYEITLLSYVF